MDRPSPRGRADVKTENTDEHKRYPARTSIARCWGRKCPDGDEHLDGRRRCSWREAGDAQTQSDFILVSGELKARRVQVLNSDRIKTDHRAVLAVLSLKA